MFYNFNNVYNANNVYNVRCVQSIVKAKRFAPHKFKNEVELFEEYPKILLTRDVYEDMFILVDEVHKEVGWLGTVEKKGNDYLIKEIFLFEQETNNIETEITVDSLAEFGTRIISKRKDGLEVANSIRFWGHSHATVGTSASNQDEQQMKVFAENRCDYFIRGIANKEGRLEFTLFLYNLGIKINDVSWELFEPDDSFRRKMWKLEIKKKVKERVVIMPKHLKRVNKKGKDKEKIVVEKEGAEEWEDWIL